MTKIHISSNRFLVCLFLLIFPFFASASPDTLSLKWKFKTGRQLFGGVSYYKGVVYTAGTDKKVYAINSQTGEKLWDFETGAALYSTPAVSNGRVFILSMDGFFYSLDAGNGKLLWKFNTGGEHKQDFWDYNLSDAAVKGGVVYFGSSDKHVYALEAATGKVQWKYKTDDMVHATPVIHNDTLFVGGFDGNIHAINTNTGSLLWKFRSIGDAYFPKGEFQKSVLFHNNTIYAGSRDFNIYAINPQTGRGKWNMKEQGSWIIAKPFVKDGRLYFGTSDTHTFYCMNAEDGKVNWKLPLNMRVYGSAVSDGKFVYFGCFNGRLYGVNPENGAVEKVFQTEGSRLNYHSVFGDDDHFRQGFELYGPDTEASEKKILSLGSIVETPLVHEGVIYINSTDGYLYALKTG